MPLTCGFTSERVTGIEPALSAWELDRSGPLTTPDLGMRCTASDRHRPCDTRVNGPPMAHVLLASGGLAAECGEHSTAAGQA